MKTYGFNKNLSNLYIFSGIGMLVLSIIVASAGVSMISAAPMAIVFTIIGFWQANTTLLKIEPDYFEFKPAVARASIRVLFKDVTDVAIDDKKIVYMTPKNGMKKKNTIALKAFNENDRQEICSLFQAAVQTNQISATAEVASC